MTDRDKPSLDEREVPFKGCGERLDELGEALVVWRAMHDAATGATARESRRPDIAVSGLANDAASVPCAYERCETECRRIARMYPEGSDGRNTFLMVAKKFQKRARDAATGATTSESRDDGDVIGSLLDCVEHKAMSEDWA